MNRPNARKSSGRRGKCVYGCCCRLRGFQAFLYRQSEGGRNRRGRRDRAAVGSSYRLRAIAGHLSRDWFAGARAGAVVGVGIGVGVGVAAAAVADAPADLAAGVGDGVAVEGMTGQQYGRSCCCRYPHRPLRMCRQLQKMSTEIC